MYGLAIFIHVVVCILLITVILIQRGRGGGLVESFSGFESIFGPKTSAFLTRLTTVLAVLFMFTCLLLASLSVIQSRSLMEKVKSKKEFLPSQNITNKQEKETKTGEFPKTE
jgi:preprotein translocase subunit SecG